MNRIRLEDFDPALFEKLINQPILFRLRGADGEFVRIQLELFRVDRLRERPPGATVRGLPLRQRPFALGFRGPSDLRPLLRYVELDDPRFEQMPVLVAAVLPPPDGAPGVFYYEAVFN